MLRQQIKSFGHAFHGIYLLFRDELHARIHLLAAIVVVSAGLWLGLSSGEWCIIILTIALVWALEAVNSAIERACDVASPLYHPAIKQSKDMAAGAVLIAAIAAIVIAIIIFVPKIAAQCTELC